MMANSASLIFLLDFHIFFAKKSVANLAMAAAWESNTDIKNTKLCCRKEAGRAMLRVCIASIH